jgi:hypoxanthine phosphoribosyltransferase
MEIQPLFDAAIIQQKVQSLGRRLNENLVSADPWIISIVGDSVLFLADLIRAVPQPVRFDFIQVQYSRSSDDADLLEVHYPFALDVTDQNLVILKDVIASGVVENYLVSQFLGRGAKQVQFAGLINIPDQRKTDFRPDYSLFATERRGTFVGYGLKHQGRYGNLPYIGLLENYRSEP